MAAGSGVEADHTDGSLRVRRRDRESGLDRLAIRRLTPAPGDRRRSLTALAWLSLVLLAALAAAAANSATTIPVPNPIVIVHTQSGGVVRDTLVPIGGVPVPIDVDNRTGLTPDIDVSVGLISVPDLPNVPVPNIVVKRDPVALAAHWPSPPVKLDARLIIYDALSLKQLATIHYGFETPPGARMPPLVSARLVGSPTGGFVDPLKALIDAPGYLGPLKFDVKAATQSFDGTFGLGFDPLPEHIAIDEERTDHGLHFTYDHSGATPDVKLDASADLTSLPSHEVRHIDAMVERLPDHLEISDTGTSSRTDIGYVAGANLGKPDVQANYRDTLGNGTVVTDANVRVAGLPSHILAAVDTHPAANGTTDIDGVNFAVQGGGQIDAVDFTATNYLGAPGNVPQYNIGPGQFVAMTSRRQPDGSDRFRVNGRLVGLRQAAFSRAGANRDSLDARIDVGDGTLPLRSILDTDNRGAPAADSPKRLSVDSTVTPLPPAIHVFYQPSTGTNPMHIVYDSALPVDVDARTLVAEGAPDACGEDRVICVHARVDKLPPHLDITLPGSGGTDFSMSHTGAAGQRPDVRAVIDLGPDSTQKPPSSRTWVDAALLGIPNEVRGRLDATGGTLRAAEFHGCAYDFAAGSCPGGTADAIGRVTFTVRDQPQRAGLPPRPLTAAQYVTVISRHAASGPKHFEIAGRVDQVRQVVFHQLAPSKGSVSAPAVLGARVDVGSGDGFDVVLDSVDDATDNSRQPPVVLGDSTSSVRVHVDALPATFSTCVREPQDQAPPEPSKLPSDSLLSPCERTDRLTVDAGEAATTPLSTHYQATDAGGNPAFPTVTADVVKTEPDTGDRDALGNPIPTTSALHVVVDRLPATLDADVIPPATGRKVKVAYAASSKLPSLQFSFVHRRTTSICADPRPDRRALCLSGTLTNLPAGMTTVVYNPDDANGGIDIKIPPPAANDPKPSLDPIHLSKVEPDPASTPLVLDGGIDGIPSHLVAQIAQRALDGGTSKSPAALSFDACPDGGACSGIDQLNFTATSVLAGDPLGPVPAPDPPVPGLDQQFSFVESGSLFRATGLIHNLRRVSYSRLDSNGAPSPVTRFGAAFGNGTPLRAYVDRDTGTETQKLDAIITHAPQAIDLCMRDATDITNLLTSGGDFCDSAYPNGANNSAADKLAIEAKAENADPTVKPSIDVRTIEMSKGGGAELLTGSLTVQDLAQRVDALVGRGAGTEISVEGHDAGDPPGAPAKDAAGRVGFNFQNFPAGTALHGYPWDSLNADAQDPQSDPRNADGGDHNYVELFENSDGGLKAAGSVPEIRSIQVTPRPCDTSSGITPDAPGFAPGPAPDYKCVRASIAPGHPLGIAVRTLDSHGSVLSIDDGHIDQMPASFAATLSSSPAANDALALCSDTHAAPCRPPVLSVQTQPQAGQPPQLQARLATGALNDQIALQAAKPADVESGLLDYEEPPRATDFPAGARLKLGTNAQTGGTALRLAAKVPLLRYIDLDPPVTFSCTSDTTDPGSASDCAASDVGADFNNGYESTNIGVRLVAADDHPYGDPAPSDPYLGRVAVMIQPLGFHQGEATQMVLTGMPNPDNYDPVLGSSTQFGHTLGASSFGEEAFPGPADIATKGFLAPAHLDARVFLRNDYNATKGGRDQQAYTQVDGRVNAPLSLTLRLNKLPSSDASNASVAATYFPASNRSGEHVPDVELTLRNGPSSNNLDDYGKPTFRLRFEQRESYKHTAADDGIGADLHKYFLCSKSDARGIQLLVAGVCVILPEHARTQYTDVQLNADPYATAQLSPDPQQQPWTTPGAARTVDAIKATSNDIDLRGWQLVDGSGGIFDKGPPADVTPAAAIRQTNFNLGFKVSAGLIGVVDAAVTYLMEGDLIFGVAGNAVERTRLSQDGMGIGLASSGGQSPNDYSRLMTDLNADERLTVGLETLFGTLTLFDASTGTFHQPIIFQGCDNPAFLTGLEDEFPTFDSSGNPGPGDDHSALGLGVPHSFSGQANVLNYLISHLVEPLGCTSVPVFGSNPSSSPLVDQTDPAPSYDITGHPVESQTGTSQSSTPAPPEPNPQGPPDLTVSAPTILCGNYVFGEIDVGGRLSVGAPGTTDLNGHACDGSLSLHAQTVHVYPTGVISADNMITGGPGQPASGLGGGAGHVGGGGASGADAASSGQGPGGNPYGNSDTDPVGDFGSAGRAGDAAAGDGGGAIVIEAEQSFQNEGKITARGGDGQDAPVDVGGSCKTGGGGGSGGAIAITANLVTSTGQLDAGGGGGGNGGFGGGGGSGGRITENTVNSDNTASAAHGGGGGSAGAFCDSSSQANPTYAGSDGADGNPGLGTRPQVISTAQLDAATPGPYTSSTPQIKLTAVTQQTDGDVELDLCHRSVPFSTASPFASPQIDPQGSGSVSALRQGATCDHPRLETSQTSAHTYTDTVTPDNAAGLANGVYGFFVYARVPSCDQPPNDGGYQLSIDPQTGQVVCEKVNPKGLVKHEDVTYIDQPNLPARATARIGLDRTNPTTLVVNASSPSGDCMEQSACLTQPHAQLTITAGDDPTGSGIRTVECRNNTLSVIGSNLTGPWMDCSAQPMTLTLATGLNKIDVRITDLAGNMTEKDGVASWFVDRAPPRKPILQVQYPDQGKNGWHRQLPTIVIDGSDFIDTSGFAPGAVSLYVDEASKSCGDAADSSDSVNAVVHCELTLPGNGEGTHTVTATATDRGGLVSQRSDAQTTKIDTQPPTSSISIDPTEPDGDNGWYRTKPVIAFAASDGPGGSGLDPAQDKDGVGTGIWVSVDGKPFARYDPSVSDDPNLPTVLGDGTHTICWYAVDVAGNREDADPNTAGDQPRCKADIKVDSTPPVISAPITPAGPDGGNGFYVSSALVTPSAADPKPSAGTDVSGVSRVEYEIDDGPWTPAAPFRVREGTHDIQVRAFDGAGNVAEFDEPTIQVDLTPPTGAIGAYPPNPNAQGWFRESRIDSVSVDDGRFGSGADGATYRLDANTAVPYTMPFSIPPGTHVVTVTPRDRAGLTGADVSQSSKIDVTAPSATPSAAPPSPLVLPGKTRLAYHVSDDHTPLVKVSVSVLDVLGDAVRHLAVRGRFADGFGTAGPGSVSWDGRNDKGVAVLPGLYYFRVQAIDQAGNSVSSTESPVFLVLVAGVPNAKSLPTTLIPTEIGL